MVDPVERQVQDVLVPIEWLLPRPPWHLFVDGPCKLAAHSVLGVASQSPSAATPLFQPHSLD